ncbi:MAG: AsmA family protein [Elsteraceae bacterium]
MRFVKYAVMAVGLLIVLMGVAIAVLVAQFKPDDYRGQIAEAIKKATGREARLSGPITVEFGWTPVVTVADFSLANIAGGSRPEMLTAARLEVSVALIPLATDRRIEVKKLAIDGVDLLLERLANGATNWTFVPAGDPAASAAPGAPSARKPLTLPTIDSLSLTKTRLTWKDGVKPPRVLLLETVQAGLPRDGSLSLAASGVLDGVVIAAETKLKSVAAVIAGQEAVPGVATVKLAGASVTLDGDFGPGAAYEGKLAAQAPALASLLALAGQQGPEPGAFALSAQIKLGAAGLAIADGAFSVGEGADKLSAKIAGTIGGDGKLDLGVTAESGNARLLQRLGVQVPDGAVALRATLGGTAPLIVAEGVDLKLGETRAQGRVALERLAPTPKLTVDMGIDRVVLAPPQKAAPQPSAAPSTAPAVESGDGRVIPAMPLPWDLLGKADAAVVLRVGAAAQGAMELQALQLRAALVGGVLTVSNLEFGFAEGHWSIRAIGKAADRSLSFGLKAEGVDAVALAKALGASPAVTSKMTIGVELAGQGADLRAILGSARGSLDLDAATGVVSASLFKGAAGGVAKILLAGRSDEDVRMECAVIHLPIQQGVARFGIGVMEMQKLGLSTSGTVNLGNEKLALKIDPNLRDAALQLLAPSVLVGGSLGRPAVEPDRAGLAVGAISAVGGLATGSTLGGLAAGQLLGTLTGKSPSESPPVATAAEICANARAGNIAAPAATPASTPAPGQIAPTEAPRPGSVAPATQDPVRGLFDMFRKR